MQSIRTQTVEQTVLNVNLRATMRSPEIAGEPGGVSVRPRDLSRIVVIVCRKSVGSDICTGSLRFTLILNLLRLVFGTGVCAIISSRLISSISRASSCCSRIFKLLSNSCCCFCIKRSCSSLLRNSWWAKNGKVSLKLN